MAIGASTVLKSKAATFRMGRLASFANHRYASFFLRNSTSCQLRNHLPEVRFPTAGRRRQSSQRNAMQQSHIDGAAGTPGTGHGACSHAL